MLTVKDRDLIRVAFAWIEEETEEFRDADDSEATISARPEEADEARVDALLDALGIALAAFAALSPSARCAAFGAYTSSQRRRSRPPLMHQRIMAAMVLYLKESDSPSADMLDRRLRQYKLGQAGGLK